MPTYLTKRWGEGIENPTHDDLVSALNELDTPDQEHPDCWLNNEEDWSISVFETGLVVFENVETGEGPWHMKDVSSAEALELWKSLEANDLETLRSKPWAEGYGNN